MLFFGPLMISMMYLPENPPEDAGRSHDTEGQFCNFSPVLSKVRSRYSDESTTKSAFSFRALKVKKRKRWKKGWVGLGLGLHFRRSILNSRQAQIGFLLPDAAPPTPPRG